MGNANLIFFLFSPLAARFRRLGIRQLSGGVFRRHIEKKQSDWAKEHRKGMHANKGMIEPGKRYGKLVDGVTRKAVLLLAVLWWEMSSTLIFSDMKAPGSWKKAD